MFWLQHHQSRHQDVNTRSAFIQTVANAQQHIWNALSVNHRNITATMVWLMTNAFTDATGPINFFTFAIQKVIFFAAIFWIWIINIVDFHTNTNFFFCLQLSLVSNVQPKSADKPLVSGRIHDMESQATIIILSHVLRDIHVWFHAAKVRFSIKKI